jgi:hypothetical protein
LAIDDIKREAVPAVGLIGSQLSEDYEFFGGRIIHEMGEVRQNSLFYLVILRLVFGGEVRYGHRRSQI